MVVSTSRISCIIVIQTNSNSGTFSMFNIIETLCNYLTRKLLHNALSSDVALYFNASYWRPYLVVSCSKEVFCGTQLSTKTIQLSLSVIANSLTPVTCLQSDSIKCHCSNFVTLHFYSPSIMALFCITTLLHNVFSLYFSLLFSAVLSHSTYMYATGWHQLQISLSHRRNYIIAVSVHFQ